MPVNSEQDCCWFAREVGMQWETGFDLLCVADQANVTWVQILLHSPAKATNTLKYINYSVPKSIPKCCCYLGPAIIGYLGLEEFVRDRLLVQGFDANLTKRSGDGGADIVVRDELGRILYLVQCKHTNDIDQPVDGGLVLDAQRVRANWQAASAAVIGISNAKKFAPRVLDGFSRIGGRLIARDELAGFTLL
jgi:hypothetical protein